MRGDKDPFTPTGDWGDTVPNENSMPPMSGAIPQEDREFHAVRRLAFVW